MVNDKEKKLTWESLQCPSNYHDEAEDPNAEWPYQKHDQIPILQPCHFSRIYPPAKQQHISTKLIHLPIIKGVEKISLKISIEVVELV